MNAGQRASEPSQPRPLDEREQNLVRRLRGGEAEAYEQLVREQTPRMLAVTRRVLRDEEAARDAVQEALIAGMRGLPGFTGRSRISTWLHRIAVNVALMKLRARAAQPELPLDELLPGFDAEGSHARPPSEWCECPDERLAKRELCALVRRAIDRLPDTHRAVLLLRDIRELDTATTARALGITPSAAKVRLHRARLALRALLEPQLAQGRA